MERFIQFEYKGKPASSIDVGKDEGTLSLDRALEPVSSHFNQLKLFIERAKKFHHHSTKHDFTEDESAAVYLYTDNCEGESLNRALNEALQSEDRALIQPWSSFLKLFNSALHKLPPVKDTIWRRLPIDTAKRLKENEELVCWGITSCSTSADVIQSIVGQNSVLCSIKPLNGKNIHQYSSLAGDHEVLLLPGTRLLVKSKGSDATTGQSVVYLEEISDASDEEIASTDVTMASPRESANEEEIDNNRHQTKKITRSAGMPDNEQSERNKTKVVITFLNGGRYRTTYEYGRKRGFGKYDCVNKEQFREQAADDKANGEGICVFQNGDRFIGTFKDGVKNGHGILYKIDGSIEVGAWVDDERTDQSLKKISNGEAYKWADESDSERWYGAYYDSKGNKYIGNVKDGNKAHGLGIRFWSDGSRYAGNFKNDKKHGFGIYYYTEKDKYVGEWVNDEIDGDGELLWSSGANYKGHFVNGKRHGKGTFNFANGKTQEGKWKNNEYLDEMPESSQL